MSRIGKLPIELSDKIEASIKDNTITVKGPKGTMNFTFSSEVSVSIEDKTITVSPSNDGANALWGTTRSIINNLVIGVSEGYTKSLEINGVGYKFEVQGRKIILSIGYSHKVEMDLPEGLDANMDEKAKNVMHISGVDKQLVGEFAAKVRAKKKPEPYKGKGIKYVGEHVRRKAGKSGK